MGAAYSTTTFHSHCPVASEISNRTLPNKTLHIEDVPEAFGLLASLVNYAKMMAVDPRDLVTFRLDFWLRTRRHPSIVGRANASVLEDYRQHVVAALPRLGRIETDSHHELSPSCLRPSTLFTRCKRLQLVICSTRTETFTFSSFYAAHGG